MVVAMEVEVVATEVVAAAMEVAVEVDTIVVAAAVVMVAAAAATVRHAAISFGPLQSSNLQQHAVLPGKQAAGLKSTLNHSRCLTHVCRCYHEARLANYLPLCLAALCSVPQVAAVVVAVAEVASQVGCCPSRARERECLACV
jgi:hypothetical protein